MSILNNIVHCGDAVVGFFAEQLDSGLKRVLQIVGSSLRRFVLFLHLVHSASTRIRATSIIERFYMTKTIPISNMNKIVLFKMRFST